MRPQLPQHAGYDAAVKLLAATGSGCLKKWELHADSAKGSANTVKINFTEL
jgi:hypothetical protein